MRRKAFERGIEEEAERQGAPAERNRHQMNELMTLGYEEAMRWFGKVGASGTLATTIVSSSTSDPALRRS